MSSFTINTNAKVNGAPIQLGTKTISLSNRASYTILGTDFTTTNPVYVDPEGDLPYRIKITELTSITGDLEFNGNPVTLDQEILYTNIVSGQLTYDANSVDASYTDTFKFDIQDAGSFTYSGLTTGVFNFEVAAYINLPPSAVGDNSKTVDHGTTTAFTRAEFTTGTTPVYADPEGDAAGQLKILSLPAQGKLQLNGANVTLNQIIDFADIDSGDFTYFANGDYAGYSVSFDFAIADVGSNQFTS